MDTLAPDERRTVTNPDPWTATGQPETKTSRTWWIVGGVVVAALAMFVVFLAGLGWEEAIEQEAAADTTSTSSLAPTSSDRDPTTADGVGGRDPVTLSEQIGEIAGVSLTHVQVGNLATRTCTALDAGATNRQVADEAAASTAGRWDDTQARLVVMMMMLEHCPRHAG